MLSAIVVGAGVFGASVADRLARSGWDVTLVERWEPGHVRAASAGESRLIRCAHGADEWHTRSARRAWRLWHELDPAVIDGRGVAWFARAADGWEAESERTLQGLGIPCSREDARDLFPSVRTDDLAFTLFEPEAGILRAREATRALVRRAVAHGARPLYGTGARPAGAAVDVGGRVLEADVVVWACGAWMPRLFPGLVELRITQQDLFFFGPADGSWAAAPGWVDYDGAAYGVGDVDGEGVKVAPDVDGPPLDVDAPRAPRPEHEALARSYVNERFPALACAPLVTARVCHYEITTDTRFVCAPHPDHAGRVWLLGGGSGHGFKHGPALAEHVQRWMGGVDAPDPRFALGARTGARALRTAGTR